MLIEPNIKRVKQNSPLENLLSKYFNQFQNLADTDSNAGHFEQEKSLHQIQQIIRNKRNPSFIKFFVAACLVVACGLSLYLINSRSKPEIVVVTTAVGEVKSIILPDGSKVWLNAKSELKYPKNLGDKNIREIMLNGEGYFEVERNVQKPFVISTEDVRTTVLGTTFNVNAYQTNASFSVTVVSGKVAVQEEGVEIVLERNEQAVFDKASKKLSKNDTIDATQNILWKEGKLVFKSVMLEEVVADIQRRYNTKIEIGENIKNCKISADFTGLPIEKIVKILGEIVNGSSSYKDNEFYLKGKGCI